MRGVVMHAPVDVRVEERERPRILEPRSVSPATKASAFSISLPLRPVLSPNM